MKLYLLSDYCRIDGETADFAEKEFREGFEKYDTEIFLFSARNQMVFFQLITEMESGETLTDFGISFTHLTGPSGSIPADYEVFIEWFHRIEGAFMPDMLLPYSKCSLDFRVPLEPEYHAGQKAGALWIDLFVPEAARKGRYEGTLRVRANQTEKEFAIRLKVYSCMVPYESRIIADLNNYADNISPSYPSLAMAAVFERMDRRGKVLNAAFAVSGAFVFGGQLAFVSAAKDTIIPAYVLSKLIGGITAGVLALCLCPRMDRSKCSAILRKNQS